MPGFAVVAGGLVDAGPCLAQVRLVLGQPLLQSGKVGCKELVRHVVILSGHSRRRSTKTQVPLALGTSASTKPIWCVWASGCSGCGASVNGAVVTSHQSVTS